MEYRQFTERVNNLGFIDDLQKADATVKAVLGIMTSCLDESAAKKFTRNLPGPLSYERLRGHQVRTEKISVNEYLAEIQTQFNLDTDQARRVVDEVLEVTKKTIDDRTLEDIAAELPEDWRTLIMKK